MQQQRVVHAAGVDADPSSAVDADPYAETELLQQIRSCSGVAAFMFMLFEYAVAVAHAVVYDSDEPKCRGH